MATAKKLPSGSYRVRVYVGASANGKKKYKSITAPTKKEAERLALEYRETNENILTFGSALDEYIAIKERVLSASTIREYKRKRNADFQPWENMPIDSITQRDVQIFINNYAQTHAPKTCADIHGIITAVLKMYRPSFQLQTTLPQKVPSNYYIPSDDDIKTLLEYLERNNKNLYNAVLLASIAPMRRSEICALLSSDISGNVIHIQRAMVRDENGGWVIKSPKTYAGDRYVSLPDFLIKRFKGIEGRLVPLTPTTVTNKFVESVKYLNLPHFRFHDLRHYGASMQHAMGIPDAYIMQRGGWGSDLVLKQIYRHALTQEEQNVNDKINKKFSDIYGKNK